MSETATTQALDPDTYQKKTEELAEAMNETTMLLAEFTANMEQLQHAFQDFNSHESPRRADTSDHIARSVEQPVGAD